ncbi:hypothetical protein [Chlamydia poikilotherma]|uniref:hypothetical protein n=1 Tax=Chlamydia poikilotherma TaxID=1967783 RepID=UPI001313D9CE|nr:hypothetical protein [Chlamydia poikilotherma]
MQACEHSSIKDDLAQQKHALRQLIDPQLLGIISYPMTWAQHVKLESPDVLVGTFYL